MRGLLLSIGGWLVVGSILAQSPEIEKLKSQIANAPDPRKKVEWLNELVAQTRDYDFEEGMRLAEEAYSVARDNEDVRGMALSGTSIGMYHYFKGDYPTALRFYWRALRQMNGQILGDMPGYTHLRIGNLYRVKGQFDSSRLYYEKAFQALRDRTPDLTLASAYYNLGLLQTATSDFEDSRRNIMESLKIRTDFGDSALMAESWRALGIVLKSLAQFKEARNYYELAFLQARQSNNPEGLMLGYIYLGELDFLEGNAVKAMRQYLQALDILKEHDFKRYHATVLQLMGRAFDALGSYDRALESFLKSLKIDEEIQSYQTAARTRGMLAWVHIRQRQDSVALNYAQLSLKQCMELHDREGIAFAKNAIGYVHFIRKQYDQAITYYNEALSEREALKMTVLSANTRYNLALVYEAAGELNKAKDMLLHVVNVDRSQNVRAGLVGALNTLGNICMQLKEYSRAEYFLKEARQVSAEIGARLELRDNYKISAELAKALDQPARANSFYEKFITLNDSIFSNQSTEKIAELNVLYQLDRKEREIQALNAQNELHQQQIEVQRARLKWQNAVLIASVLVVILLAAIAFVLYRYYRDKARAEKALRLLNRDLQEKKEEVETQAEELSEANQQLTNLNRDLSEKQEEIHAQSEELMEANQTIQVINRNLEAAVEERTAQLKEAYRELDTFFYRASHDFRRPLTTFMGLAEVAGITVKDRGALELFDKVKETARNLDKMLAKLQSVAAVAASDTAFREVHFRSEADRVYDAFKEELIASRIDFRTEIRVTRPFLSYPEIIRMMITNLVENAIQFGTPEQPRISLVVEEEPGLIILKVADNGEGIPAEYHQKVFDMYFRASEKSKGNGLGLYIVRKSVEKLAGTVQIESTKGAGTTVIVRLPRQDQATR